jgi:Protein of unknown function (DUF2867)
VPRISAADFSALPLRAHAFLAGVPLHDVWVVDLPGVCENVTLAEFNPLARRGRAARRFPTTTRALFALRSFLGRLFRLEDEPKGAAAASFAARLTPADRARSSTEPGTPEGPFRVVYRFENEQLLELHNRTAHAAVVGALAETAAGYRYYFAVYVADAGWITPFYMALIDPFRRWIVYPALLKSIRTAWLDFVSAGK